MKKNYTHITIILDRTGSMESIRDDTIGGFNTFLKEQKKESGTATLTLVQFDSQDPFEIIYDFKDIKKIPKLTRETFVLRASTPLLDALGRCLPGAGRPPVSRQGQNQPTHQCERSLVHPIHSFVLGSRGRRPKSRTVPGPAPARPPRGPWLQCPPARGPGGLRRGRYNQLLINRNGAQ